MVSGWKTAAYQKLTHFSGTTQSEENVYLGKMSFRENASLEPCCWLKGERKATTRMEGAKACLLVRAAKTGAELVPQQWKTVGKAGDQRWDIAPAAGPPSQQRASDFHRAWRGTA